MKVLNYPYHCRRKFLLRSVSTRYHGFGALPWRTPLEDLSPWCSMTVHSVTSCSYGLLFASATSLATCESAPIQPT